MTSSFRKLTLAAFLVLIAATGVAATFAGPAHAKGGGNTGNNSGNGGNVSISSLYRGGGGGGSHHGGGGSGFHRGHGR